MINYINNSLLAIALFLAVFTLYVLLESKSKEAKANKILALWLAINGILLLMFYLFQTQFITYVPWLYRLPSPLYYMFFPMGYLYVRMILNDERKLVLTDTIHFIPAVLHFLEFLPFYLLPLDAKAEILRNDLISPLGMLTHSQGMLPPYVHNYIRGAQSLFYGGLMWWVIHKQRKRSTDITAHENQMFRWLYAISALQIIYAITLLTVYPSPNIDSGYKYTIIYALISASFIYVAAMMVRKPSILMGMPKAAVVAPIKPALTALGADGYARRDNKKASPHTEWRSQIIQIENYFIANSPFLNPEYRLSDLARDLNIPTHQLSYIFNHVLNKSFINYLNELRINYLKELTRDEKSNNYTLEALALKAGFGSRSSFIRVTKKLTGETPSILLKNTESA